MPKHTQVVSFKDQDALTLRSISFATLDELGWTTLNILENILVANTIQTKGRYANKITIEVAAEQITVTSEMFHGELFDMMGRTKKDVKTFLEAFESVRSGFVAGSNPVLDEKFRIIELQTRGDIDDLALKLGGPDNKKHKEKLKLFGQLGETAEAVYNQADSLSKEEYISRLETISLSKWNEAEQLFEDYRASKISPDLERSCELVIQYCQVNKRKTLLLIKAASEDAGESDNEKKKIEDEIDAILSEMQKA